MAEFGLNRFIGFSKSPPHENGLQNRPVGKLHFFSKKYMSCLLRISGERLDVDSLLSGIILKPDRIWRRGEPRLRMKPNGKLNERSGVSFVASDAGFREFDQQVEDATRFLEDHCDQVLRLVQFQGVDEAALDFGIELRDVAMHSDYLTPRLLKAAAAVGVAVELSHYPISSE